MDDSLVFLVFVLSQGALIYCLAKTFDILSKRLNKKCVKKSKSNNQSNDINNRRKLRNLNNRRKRYNHRFMTLVDDIPLAQIEAGRQNFNP